MQSSGHVGAACNFGSWLGVAHSRGTKKAPVQLLGISPTHGLGVQSSYFFWLCSNSYSAIALLFC